MTTTRLSFNVNGEILKAILGPNGKYASSVSWIKKLGLQKTTIHSGHGRLEKEFLELSYSLKFKKFDWRKVD